MSADFAYSENADVLLRDADTLDACERFDVDEGGSRHFCAHCDKSRVEHIAVALREKLRRMEAKTS